MFKNKKSKKTTFILLALVLITSLFVGVTLARYVTTTSSEDKARVAVWGINADTVEMNLFDSEYTANGLKVVKSNDGDKIIAPGTSMSSQFSIVTLDAIAPEVMYEIKINLDDSEIDPRILENSSIQWKLDDNDYDTWEKTKQDILNLSGHTSGVKTYAPGTVATEFANGKTHTIYWRWLMDDNNDIQDTELGNSATKGDIVAKIAVKITARQVDRDTTGMLFGDGQVFNKVNPKTLSFSSAIALDDFVGVTVDGEDVSNSNYEILDGSPSDIIPSTTLAYLPQGSTVQNETLNYSFNNETFSVNYGELKTFNNYENLHENSFIRIVPETPIDIDRYFKITFDLETAGIKNYNGIMTTIPVGIRLFDNTTGTTLYNTIGYIEKYATINNGIVTVSIPNSLGFDRSGYSDATAIKSIGVYLELNDDSTTYYSSDDAFIKINNAKVLYDEEVSLTVKLKENYLSTLSEGTHELRINTENSFSIASFEIQNGLAKIGETSYSTLQDAINNATSGATVKLIANIEESVTIATDDNISIDLNGYNITANYTDELANNPDAYIDNYSAIVNNGTLTIKGNGTISAKTTGSSALFNKGTATLLGGTYTRNLEADLNKFYTVTNIGTLTIDSENVLIESNSTKSSSLANGYNLTNSTNYNGASGTLIINNGTIQGGRHAIANNLGNVIIAGGSVLAKASDGKDAIGVDAGTVTINGGTISSSNVAMTVEGTSVVIINDGTITGTINAVDTATVTDNRE